MLDISARCAVTSSGLHAPARDIEMNRKAIAVVAVVAIALTSFVAIHIVRGQAHEPALELTAVLTPPPLTPPPVERDRPATVDVSLETVEAKGRLASDVTYNFWTFNGTVPGPFIRVRVGDTLRIKLKNAKSSMNWHSVNFHAATGPGGGGSVQVPPGEEREFQWKALHTGLFVYHCMTPHVPIHIANGMYGLILVEPEGGLPPVDREYYVMQGEFYTKGRTLQAGFQAFDVEKAHAEKPEYVVFNGAMDSLLNDGALKGQVGETVRLFVGNGGPTFVSSFHVVGAVFDAVYPDGAIGSPPQKNVQMTMIPTGSAAIMDFKLHVPGRFFLVDHSYFRSHEKGTLGALDVTGPFVPSIFSAKPNGAWGH